MKKSIIRAISALLLVVFLFALGITVSGTDRDYSSPGSLHKKTVYAGDVIEKALGITLDSTEKSYLELYCDFSLTLPQTAPSSYVSTEYNEDEKTLSVSVMPYVYELSDGTRVEWLPKYARLWDRELPLLQSDGEYKCTFCGVEKRENNTENSVSAVFEYSITVSEEAFNSFLNKAYYDIPALREEHERKTLAYQTALSEYEQNRLEYRAYLEALSEYRSDYAIYEKYLEQKKIYDEKYSEFLRYKSELEQYEKDVVAYGLYEKKLAKFEEDYVSYLYYLDHAEKYDEEMSKYKKYLADIETVRLQLQIIEQTKTKVTSLKRSIYSGITGTTVTSVIENKTLIVNTFKVNPAVVDLAGRATENLRELFRDYFSFNDEADKYAYYVMNYEAIRDNFVNLLRALDKLYENEGVSDTLRTQNKEEKYIILLAQLYKISNALSAEPIYNYDGTGVFDGNYRIQNFYSKFPPKDSFYNKYKVNKAPAEVITETDYYVDIGNPIPLEFGYPNEQKQPELLVTVEPVRPEFMKKPVEPELVQCPERPDEVSEPQKPDEVYELAMPEAYIPDTVILNLIDENYSISLREEADADIVLREELNVTRQFLGRETVSVVFHDTEGNELYSVSADKGTSVDYYGIEPTKPEDVRATYSFSAWVDISGAEPDLSCVTEDLHLYPSFSETLKKYSVTWLIDGEEIAEEYEYGSLPSCPVTPIKSDTGIAYYVFSGFDSPITAVSENVTYTAKFQKKYYISYNDGEGAPIKYEGDKCIVDASLNNANGYAISKLVEKIAGKYSLEIMTRHGTLRFSYSDTLLLKSKKIESFVLETGMIGEGAYEYKISLFDNLQREVLGGININLDLPCRVPDSERLILYHISDNEKKQVSYTASQSNIKFKASAGTKYFAACEYKITTVPCEILSLCVDKAFANYGSTVFVSYRAKKGIEVKGTYYVNAKGEKVYFENYFTLTSDVSVGIDYEYTEYTVSFVSGGKVISSNKYHYGDMPSVPKNPKKPSDGSYTYVFIGWSEEIEAVTKDAVYEARYWSSPIPEEQEKLIVISDSILRFILLGASGIFIFLFGAIPCVVLSIIFARKRKKKLNASENRKTDK